MITEAPLRRTVLALTLTVFALPAYGLTAEDINKATFAPVQVEAAPVAPPITPAPVAPAAPAPEAAAPPASAEAEAAAKKMPDPRVIKSQVLLDRRRLSPGAIDGYDGDNFRKAITELRRRAKLPDAGDLDAAVWAALDADAATDIMTEYTVTAADAAYPFAPTPKDYAELAQLKMIGYRTAAEMIGERFHMDENLVRELNPTIENWKEGDRLVVAAIDFVMPSLSAGQTSSKSDLRAARILVERGRGAVTAFDAQGEVLAIYPATVGSADTPTPDGVYTVKGVARNPTYSYRPDVNFKQGNNTEKLTLPPGPNGPVGTVWIDLSKPTYGIHGTPEPSSVSKNASHGCVRLTNWDAEHLASMTRPGVKVEFVE
ncbi:MAG: L,D-transpeptidase [Pseudolabrys sp.]|nr:L,D-transpeptidase [Pseudolabrys sp.]